MTERYCSIFRPGLFAGKVAIITGGGSGIGRCAAHELSSLGARIALLGRKQDKLDKVKAEIEALGGEVDTFAGDIRNEEGVKETIAAVLRRFGRIDHLVNNAGGQYRAALEDITLNGWDAVIRSNLNGGFVVSRECFTQWMKEHGGAIVNIVMDNWCSTPMMGHSGAARAGMVNFTETAAVEWGPYNVRVNGVAPGGVASSGFDHYPESEREFLRTYSDTVPLGRVGTEAETSSAIVFLLSEGAAYISGTTVRVDGAVSASRPWYPLPKRDTSSPVYNGFHLYTPPQVLRD
ncbi:MAG: 2,4-dienoyl-CoA reductase [Betaproteobacteria bacterium HGW-Betaproteobacteria-5]|nr:MAG: 2,4-dienoyl-CoA reductase [Betaproteobacteria bacterium HGW-Betaproteobacteria-5]PKO41153.1 MAG: 2,4-dienoyl-CoA reductase [Betaproteobacteria bacterium HGW-Betaproteobacteria-6]